jgi:hypothetical protein
VLAGGTSHPAHTDPKRQARVGHEARRDVGGSLSEIPQLNTSFIPTATPASVRNTIPPAPEPTPSGNPMGQGLDALLVAKMMRGKNPAISDYSGADLTQSQQDAITNAVSDALVGSVGGGSSTGSVYRRGGQLLDPRGGRTGRNSKRGT